jgi:hypothetical protein
MKKILLAFALFLVSTVAIAQEKIESYALQIGFWNAYTEQFDYQPVQPCDVVFFLQGDMIIANDEAKSTYYTYECTLQIEGMSSWNAYDEGRRKCGVSMIFGKTSFLIVAYSDACYRYFVNL